jgi:hypothetical protein
MSIVVCVIFTTTGGGWVRGGAAPAKSRVRALKRTSVRPAGNLDLFRNTSLYRSDIPPPH